MGQPNGITTSFVVFTKNVFKLYLWCVDKFPRLVSLVFNG